MHPVDIHVGKRLRQQREHRNMSQTVLGDAVGIVPGGHVARLFRRGERLRSVAEFFIGCGRQDPCLPAPRRGTVAIDAAGLDHEHPGPGDDRVFGEQLGPGRSARAMAMVHIAIFDAVNAFDGRYRSFSNVPRVPDWTSMEAAVAAAAHDTLVAMYPSQADDMNEEMSADMAQIGDGPAKTNGIRLGQRAAAAQRLKPRGIGASILARIAWPKTGAAPSVEMPMTSGELLTMAPKAKSQNAGRSITLTGTPAERAAAAKTAASSSSAQSATAMAAPDKSDAVQRRS